MSIDTGIEIESGVPIPERARPGSKGERGSKYRFGELVPGQSISLPITDAKRLSHSATVWRRKHPGWNYTIRSMDDVVRLWRTP